MKSGDGMNGQVTPDWIAVDWGTTNLRAWAMSDADTVLARAESPEGMGTLSREGFEPALLRLIGPWLTDGRRIDVVACGMVGSKQGWVEAGYSPVPCAPEGARPLARPVVIDPRFGVSIIPGLSQNKPADVMRGEETQIAGYLATQPGFDGVICLPGTHTKWARVSAGEVVSFQTFMTGEMFALLSRQSVLRHGLSETGWDDAAFEDALGTALSRPEGLASRLFSLRAEGLLHGLSGVAARSALSGLLIGAELAAARPYWLGQQVVLVGARSLCTAYAAGLAAQGVPSEWCDVETLTLAGLASARAGLGMGRTA